MTAVKTFQTAVKSTKALVAKKGYLCSTDKELCTKHIKMKPVAKDWRKPVLSGSFQVPHKYVKPVSALKKKPALRKLERRISLTPKVFHKNYYHPDRYLELSKSVAEIPPLTRDMLVVKTPKNKWQLHIPCEIDFTRRKKKEKY